MEPAQLTAARIPVDADIVLQRIGADDLGFQVVKYRAEVLVRHRSIHHAQPSIDVVIDIVVGDLEEAVGGNIVLDELNPIFPVPVDLIPSDRDVQPRPVVALHANLDH